MAVQTAVSKVGNSVALKAANSADCSVGNLAAWKAAYWVAWRVVSSAA